MTNPQLNVGDLVDVFIKGARVIDVDSPLAKQHGPAIMVAIPGLDEQEARGAVWTELDAITITVVEPATGEEWPPRPGDLWRDRDGELWFGTTAHVYRHGPGDFPAEPVVELVHAGGGPSRLPVEVNRECGPLALVHREQAEQPGGSWPPEVGDVWRDRDGDLWFAVDMNDGTDLPSIEFVLMHAADHEDPDEARRRWGPICLVYRAQPGAEL